jgi:hypothetical protein
MVGMFDYLVEQYDQQGFFGAFKPVLRVYASLYKRQFIVLKKVRLITKAEWSQLGEQLIADDPLYKETIRQAVFAASESAP